MMAPARQRLTPLLRPVNGRHDNGSGRKGTGCMPRGKGVGLGQGAEQLHALQANRRAGAGEEELEAGL